MESAEFLNQYMGFATAQGLHGKLMTGVPAGGLENCIEKLESQGKKIVVVEQVGKSKSRMIREIRYVTGSLILNRSNLILEYKP
jgi:DNA mismatch repair ATPase MutS